MNRHRRGQESTEALEYYDKCLNLLIPTISDPENHVTEEVFAAVAILRQYEEMDCMLASSVIILMEHWIDS